MPTLPRTLTITHTTTTHHYDLERYLHPHLLPQTGRRRPTVVIIQVRQPLARTIITILRLNGPAINGRKARAE
ncbi:hypothetical protein FRC19_002494 [Serendipita sp. 401]|nr:hypothetical protein FRC19_002494 [Serendipita sp. 401]